MRNDAMSLSPMDIVKQTGTTIIFEEFDSNKPDLITLLTKDEDELPIEKFRNLIMGEDSELVVKSFSEFEEKFSPIIYETVVMEDGEPKFVYKLDKPKGECTQIKLKDHVFYKMIKNILDGKSHSDNGNLDFNYDEFKKALSPKESLEECKKIRKRLLANTKEYIQLVESGKPNSVEKKRLEKNIVAIRKKIIDKYDNKSPLNLLPILIADKQTQIDALNEVKNPVLGNLEFESKITSCKPVFNEKGLIEFVNVEENVDIEMHTESKDQEYLETVAGVLKNDFISYAPAEYKDNDFVAGMIANAYTGGGGKSVYSTDLIKIEEEKAKLQKIYKDTQESFAKAVIDTVQRFIGVKSFFDHAAYKGKLGRNIKLIVANCKFNKLLADDVAKERFKFYFNAFSNEKDVNRIWFGIVPSVRLDVSTKGADSSENITCSGDAFGPMHNTSDKVKEIDDSGSQLDSLNEMLSLLSDAKIMAFTNDKAGKDTGFVSINADKVRDYDNALKSVNSEYAVFCYPNFTILPEEKTAVKIGYKLDEYNSKGDEYCELPGVYLDSSYVACGMVVGIQNYEFLKSKGFNVDSRFPCVRFSLEDEEHSKIITTNLNRETTTEMLKETKAAMSEYRFGFAFADNRIIYKDKILNNSYVINERTLKRDTNGIYKPVCWTLVKNTIDQMLRSIDDNLSRKTFNIFQREYVDSWKRDGKDDSKRFDNRILLDGETVTIDEDKDSANKLYLQITFNGEPQRYEDIVFTEQTEDNNGGN